MNLSAQQTSNLIPLATVIAALLALVGVVINLYFTRRLAKDREAFEVSMKKTEHEAALKVAMHKERVNRFAEVYTAALRLREAFTTERAKKDQDRVIETIIEADAEHQLAVPIIEMTSEMSKALIAARIACAAVLVDGTAQMRSATNQLRDLADAIEGGWKGTGTILWADPIEALDTTYAREKLKELDRWIEAFPSVPPAL
ncbi:hypothetical protein V1L54_27460 [Streptomyces sp. TRM 70361]|uniref:hypothetical protein n=1 Tax=Streptomyces sp. TRM 70361 TaxID=3116553 RepID=UPI002E7B7CB2|nr:hypothetical protein [Streptomyces sp. TRM 70361]MEE1943099.1 hypothetical protein [Streptomyces sp. TRM 70361]